MALGCGLPRGCPADDAPVPVAPRVSTLNFAVETGDVAEVKALLAADPALVNAQESDETATFPGVTPLQAAVFWRKKDIVALLLANKADINGKDSIGRRALHIAVRYSEPEMLTLLLADGADVNAPDNQGRTPLREALVVGYLDMAKVLTAHGAAPDIWTAAALGQTDEIARLLRADPASLNRRDDLGRTALHWAAERGQTRGAEMLTEAGADVAAQDYQGDTPLHLAVAAGWDPEVKTAALLLQHGAPVNARNKDGDTPLLAACEKTYGDFAYKLLLAHGADVTVRGKDGRTALHMGGGWPMIAALYAHGADVNARDEQGRTPLHVAANVDSFAWSASLLAHGADVNARDRAGQTPLWLAAQAGYTKTPKVLLAAKGAAVDVADSHGQTPLWAAAREGHMETVALLLARGARAGAPDSARETPLDAAILHGHGDVGRLLLAHGAVPDVFAASFFGLTARLAALLHADPALANAKQDGTTPLLLAAGQNQAGSVKQLIAAGADVNARGRDVSSADRFGGGFDDRPPLYVALQAKHQGIADLLLAAGADARATVTQGFYGPVNVFGKIVTTR